MYRQKVIDFVIYFLEEVNREISEMSELFVSYMWRETYLKHQSNSEGKLRYFLWIGSPSI